MERSGEQQSWEEEHPSGEEEQRKKERVVVLAAVHIRRRLLAGVTASWSPALSSLCSFPLATPPKLAGERRKPIIVYWFCQLGVTFTQPFRPNDTIPGKFETTTEEPSSPSSDPGLASQLLRTVVAGNRPEKPRLKENTATHLCCW